MNPTHAYLQTETLSVRRLDFPCLQFYEGLQEQRVHGMHKYTCRDYSERQFIVARRLRYYRQWTEADITPLASMYWIIGCI